MDNNTFFNPPPRLNTDTRGGGNRPSSPPPIFGPDMPGRISQPPSPPPNFIPDSPGAEPQTFTGRDERSTSFRGRRPGQPGSIWRCLNRFTFLWLINGNSFWFYPISVDRQRVEGFRWRNNRWVYDRISRRSILFFRCF